MKAASKILWQLVNLVVTVNFNGLLGGVHDHVALVAPMEMLIQFHSQVLIDPAVKVIGQLFQKFCALHRWPSLPFLDLKYFAKRSRS